MEDPRDLVGTWRLERSIEDRRADQRHLLVGRLEVEPDGDGLSWRESLVWHRDGDDVDTYRTLLLRRTDAGWWVRFDDGRDFHPWRPGEPVTHPCAPDTYTGLVEGGLERWSIIWHAVGPEKDYTMTSVLTPHPETPRSPLTG